MKILFILLQAAEAKLPSEPEQATFWDWFLWETVGAGVVFALLYYFFIKNPKINPPRKNRSYEDFKD
jgi:hypothetical protein